MTNDGTLPQTQRKKKIETLHFLKIQNEETVSEGKIALF